MMIYKINSENKEWSAEISALHGANVTRLKYNNRDVFIPLVSSKQLENNPYIQGCPILLPANRTYGGEFRFEGKHYHLPLNEPQNNAHLHGFVHRAAFELLMLKVTESYWNM